MRNGYFAFCFFWLAGVVMGGLLVWWFGRKKIGNIYQNLLQKLDRAIAGNFGDTVYDESMDAAVSERLNRLVQISGLNQGRAERERDFVKSLISDISHQVRTPLANITLYLGLLREQKLKDDAMVLAEKIGEQSDRLGFFMKALVRSAYAEQEMISIHPEMVNVEEMIDAACQLVEMETMKKEICIVKEESGVCCYADKKWTVEALGNVLENAVKYSPKHTEIEVKVLLYESFVCIEVKDQGIGIREEEQGKIFERFYRSEAVRDEVGFGIGLYLVREVLSKQGGYAKVRSNVGEGTAIQLYLSRYGEIYIDGDS